MFNRPTLKSLVQTAEAEINALILGADARMRFSVFNVFARVWAALVDGLYSGLVYLSRQLFVSTASRLFLTRIADSYGIYRLPASAAQGCVFVQGAAGSIVPVGTVFQRADGTQYRTTAGVTLPPSGYTDIPCIAETVGVIGNAAPLVQVQSTTAITGVALSQVCAAGIAGGADEESDTALRARVYQRLRNPPGAGTVSDWTRWALSLGASVTRVWVVPTVYGNGSVGVVFAEDGAGVVPLPSRIAQMQAHLAQFTPVGSQVYVFAPTLVPVNFTIHEIPNGDPAVRLSIINELRDLLYREAAPQNTIPLSHITEAISNAQGERDHNLLMPAAPLVFTGVAPTFQVGVLGTVNWV